MGPAYVSGFGSVPAYGSVRALYPFGFWIRSGFVSVRVLDPFGLWVRSPLLMVHGSGLMVPAYGSGFDPFAAALIL